MELLAGLLALGPLAFLIVLLAIQTWWLWPKRPARWWADGLGGTGGDPAGDREPRRPLLPSAAGRVALPERHGERRAS